MATAELTRPAETAAGIEAEIEAVIAQARRRQRRRLRAIVVAVVLGCVAGLLAAYAGAVGRPASATGGAGSGGGLSPLGVSATVVMYPVRAPAAAPLGTGLEAYVGDLRTGHLYQRRLPGIINCDCGSPLVATVGNWLVYLNYHGTISAVPASLTGKPRTVGDTNMFAPAATPGHVWLQYESGGPTVVRLVPVAGGRAGPPVSLPVGTALVQGTASALLLQQIQNGNLELWNPGSRAVPLPESAAASLFAVTPEVVVYGTRCTAVDPSGIPAANVAACGELLAYRVSTRSVAAFPAPAGTAGWFAGVDWNTPAAVSPDNATIAAMDLGSAKGRAERLFVLSVAAGRRQPRLVPSASGSLLTWSADGNWLLYQGPGRHLWAYQPATGEVRRSAMPCCSYWAMTALPGAH